MNSEVGYDTDYLDWKNWDSSNFGKLTKSQKAYFYSEIKKIVGPHSEGLKVLEIGFGNGSFLEYGRQELWDISGTELNANLVEIAKERGYKDVYHSKDLSSFQNNSFDLVVAFDVLEHIHHEQLINFLNNIKRVLKSGGYFIARFPNGDSPLGLANQNGDITHQTSIGIGKIFHLSRILNLELISCQGEALPLKGIGVLLFIHRLITLPINWILNTIFKILYFPRENITFFSRNLVVILKVLKN